jgi:S1-C subfamily serine protease
VALASLTATGARADASESVPVRLTVPRLAANSDGLQALVVEVRARGAAAGSGVLLRDGLVLARLRSVAALGETGDVQQFQPLEVVSPGGQAMVAILVAGDSRLDVALLRLAGGGGDFPAQLAQAAPVSGEPLLAVSATSQSVAAVDVVVEGVERKAGMPTLIRTSGRFGPRFWGGALFNSGGELVGVLVPGGSGGAAIPAALLLPLVDKESAARRPMLRGTSH